MSPLDVTILIANIIYDISMCLRYQNSPLFLLYKVDC